MSEKYRGCLMKRRTWWTNEDEFCYFEFTTENDFVAFRFLVTLVHLANLHYDKQGESREVYIKSLHCVISKNRAFADREIPLTLKIEHENKLTSLKRLLEVFYYSKDKKCILRQARKMFMNFKPDNLSLPFNRYL